MKKFRALFAVLLTLAVAATGFGGVFVNRNAATIVNAAGGAGEPKAMTTEQAMDVLASGRTNLEDIEPTSFTPSKWQSTYPFGSNFAINTAKGLANFSMLVNDFGIGFSYQKVYLENSFDYKSGTINYSNPTTYFTPIGTTTSPFEGVFDGGGNEIDFHTKLLPVGPYGVGFFGVTDGAMIMNLDVAGSITTPSNSPLNIGGIIGRAKNTTIFNCVSKVDIKSITSGCKAGGIIGSADPASTFLRITNCVNYGEIDAPNPAGIIYADNAEVRVCINFGELSNYSYDFEDAGHDIREWGTASNDWVDAGDFSDKKELLREFNTDIHNSKVNDFETHSEKVSTSDWRNYKYIHVDDGSDCYCLWARFWGFVDPSGLSTDEIAMAMPRIYNNTIFPILESEIMLEFQLKNLAASQILTWFISRYTSMDGGDDLANEYRAKLIVAFWEVMAAAQTRTIHECDSGDIEVEFPETVDGFLFDIEYGSNAHMDEVYWEWYEESEARKIQSSYNLAYNLMMAWYEDCYAFIIGDDDLAEEAKDALDAKCDEILGEGGKLDKLVEDAINSSDLELQIDSFIMDNYGEFDNIYYAWEFDVMLVELEDAFDEIYDAASGGNKAKVQALYDDAVIGINKARTDDCEWTKRSAVASSIHNDLLTEFDSLLNKWDKERTRTIWISVTAGIVLLAGGVVTVLLIVMRKREKKYNSIAFDNANRGDWKEKRLSRKMEEVSRSNEAQRERAEEIARIQREKAEALAKMEREKRELQVALQRSAHAYATAAAKQPDQPKKDDPTQHTFNKRENDDPDNPEKN